jgi:hypothetical protein
MNRRQLLAATGLAAGSLFLPSRSARAQSGPPKRLVILFTQHGLTYDTFKMRANGAGDTDAFELDLAALAESEMSEILRPLHPHRSKLTVVDGLSLASAEVDIGGNGHDIGTRHALTGALLSGGAGGGPSIDQVVASRIALTGRINSLELAVLGAANGGAVWRDAGQSLPPDSSPGSVFSRVFPPSVGGTTELSEADRVRLAQGSVLDLVRAEYDAIAPRLSRPDRQKLELHRDLVRDVEKRLEDLANVQCVRPAEPGIDGETLASLYATSADAMFRLSTAALACDLTRVITIQMAQLPNELIGAPPGDVHADFAHQEDNNDFAHQMMTNYARVHAEHMASLMAMLDAVPEGNGTLLDNCAVVWCSELADGLHRFEPWWAVVGGGALPSPGRYVNLPRATPNPSVNTNYPGYQAVIGPPHNRFWVNVAQAVGANISSLGLTEATAPSGARVSMSDPLPELS